MTQVDEVVGSLARRVSEGKRFLSCKLSDQELLERGRELAEQVEALNREETAQDTQRKAMRNKLAGMAEVLSRLAKVVEAQQEDREVMVIGDLVATAEGTMVRESRADTGETLVIRQPTAQELQPTLQI